MNCSEIYDYINDYLDQDLASPDLGMLRKHLDQCAHCREKFDSATTLLSQTRNLGVPAPSPEFKQRIFAEVRKQYPAKPSKLSFIRFGTIFGTGFATAAVASLAAWFFISMPPQPPELSVSEPVKELAALQTITVTGEQPVRLVFDAKQAFPEVQLSVVLPANVSLAGYPGLKKLSWKTELKQGQNILTLPFSAINAGEGELHTQLNYNNNVKTYRIVLKTENSDIQNPSTIKDTLIHNF